MSFKSKAHQLLSDQYTRCYRRFLRDKNVPIGKYYCLVTVYKVFIVCIIIYVPKHVLRFSANIFKITVDSHWTKIVSYSFNISYYIVPVHLFSRSDSRMVRVVDCSDEYIGSRPEDAWHSFHCIALTAFYDGITGPTEFISVVDSVKMVDMPLVWLPCLDSGKMSRYIIIYYYYYLLQQ